ncbi:MAG: MBL fold metallo-hydrolase [Ardenticatenales bacterium]
MGPPSAVRSREPVLRIVIPAVGAGSPRNAWLLTGEPITLVDPGPATAAAYGAVRDALTAFGYSIRDVERIVVTHAHGGHAGLTARLQADSGARVLAHPDVLDALCDPLAAAARRVANERRAAVAAGVPEQRASQLLDGMRATLSAELADSPVGVPRAATAALADGERLSAAHDDEARWTVVHTGDHCPDHIALTHALFGLAVTGDTIERHRPMPPDLAPSAAGGARPALLGAQMRAWRRLALVAPTAWLPGHGERIRAPRVLVARRVAETRAALHATRRALGDAPESAWRIAVRLDLVPRDDAAEDGAALDATALRTIVARLDWLVERGAALRSADHGEWRFVAAPAGRSSAPRPRRR